MYFVYFSFFILSWGEVEEETLLLLFFRQVFFLFFLFFLAQAGLELAIQLKMTLNSGSTSATVQVCTITPACLFFYF